MLVPAILVRDGGHGQHGAPKSTMASEWQILDKGFDFLDARFVATSFVVILLYDHLLTFEQEIQGVWKRKLTRVSIMFLTNRYLVPMFYLFVVVSLINPDVSSHFCQHVFNIFPPVVIVISEAVIGTMYMLRTRALWLDALNYVWVALVVVLFSLQTMLSVWTATQMGIKTSGPYTDFHVGCSIHYPESSEGTIRLALYWLLNITFNVSIFLCTLRRTLMLRKNGMELTLAGLLQRDGTVYFVCLLLVKLTNLVMLLLYPEWNIVNWSFNHVFDVIMTSRIMLNLRVESRAMLSNSPTTTSGKPDPSIEFRTSPLSPSCRSVILIGPDGDEVSLPSPLVCSPSTIHPYGRSPVQSPSVEWMLHALYEVLGEQDYARVMRAAGQQAPPQRNVTFTAGQNQQKRWSGHLAPPQRNFTFAAGENQQKRWPEQFDPEGYLAHIV